MISILTNIVITCIIILAYDIIKKKNSKEIIKEAKEKAELKVKKIISKNNFNQFKNKKGLYEPYKPSYRKESAD